SISPGVHLSQQRPVSGRLRSVLLPERLEIIELRLIQVIFGERLLVVGEDAFGEIRLTDASADDLVDQGRALLDGAHAPSAALVTGLVRAPRDLRQVPERVLEDARDVLIQGRHLYRRRDARTTGHGLEVLLRETFAFEGALRI